MPRAASACPRWPLALRTLGLVALLLLLHQGEQRLGLHARGVEIWLFSFLPVLLAILWLRPAQVGLLGMLFLVLMGSEIVRDPLLLESTHASRLIAFALMAGLCVWISSQRQRLAFKRQQLIARAVSLSDNARLLEIQLATSRRAAALAHELRQPLTAIQLQSRRLLRLLNHHGHPDPAVAAAAMALHGSADELNRTIGAMANLMRSTGSDRSAIDLAAVVSGALDSLQARIASERVVCTSEGLEEPLTTEGDPELLRIACLNLLRNAIEAVRPLPAERRQVRIRLERQADQACLVVADSGPGLPQALPNGSRKPAGMGLGLFITQTVAQQHRGELQAGQSPELGGAELRLWLPCRP